MIDKLRGHCRVITKQVVNRVSIILPFLRRIFASTAAFRVKGIMRHLNSANALYAAVVVLLITAAIGYYVDIKNEEINARNLELNIKLERMVRLNQELTNMLMISVLEQNALRSASFETVSNDLTETVNSVMALTKIENLMQEIATLSESQKAIREFEEHIIMLMRADNWTEAKAVLFGDEYVLARKTYDVESDTAMSAVTTELASDVKRFNSIKTATLALRVGALLLLVWIGFMFSKRTKADIAEQVRLSNEISAAYDEMEERVRDRTKELEETTRMLDRENTERARSDARTRLILNSVGEGIISVDTENRITFINETASALLGYTGEDVAGRDIHELIHHSYIDGAAYPWESCPVYIACTTGEKKHISDEALWRKDGTHFLSEYSVTPLIDEAGTITGAVMVFRDITERKKSEEMQNHRMQEMERFNRLTMGREERMIQLKEEINALLADMGREKKYKILNDGAIQ